jgi:hypothetical protein
MMHVKKERLAQSAVRIDAIPLDVGRKPRRSLFARCVARLLQALHESRRRQGQHTLARYRHLTSNAETHPDLDILRRPCQTDKSSG